MTRVSSALPVLATLDSQNNLAHEPGWTDVIIGIYDSLLRPISGAVSTRAGDTLIHIDNRRLLGSESALNSSLLCQFLQQLYAARRPISGQTTVGGDAFIQIQRLLEKVSITNVKQTTRWQYVPLMEALKIRTVDTQFARQNEYYQVPGVGGVFRAENARLRALTISEAREQAAQLPSADKLNAVNYEKVYVINQDGSQTLEYAPKAGRNSPQQQGGRNTYRYDAGSDSFRQTGRVIDGDNRMLSLPGGGSKKRPTASDLGVLSNKHLRRKQKTRAPTIADLKTWRNMSQTERNAVGGARNYASGHNINHNSWRNLANKNGLSQLGVARLQPARTPSNMELETWRDMSQAQRNAVGSASGFALTNGINLNSWKVLANNEGLTPTGEAKLLPGTVPSIGNLTVWRDMTQEERKAAGGAAGYVQANKINSYKWMKLVNDEGLTDKGSLKVQAVRVPTDADVFTWSDMTQAERDSAGGYRGYAQKNNINFNSWKNLASNTGLRPAGLARLKEGMTPIDADLTAWRDMTQEERNAAGGALGYSQTHNINYNLWRTLTNNSGLSLIGQRRFRSGKTPTNDDLITWRDIMTQEERNIAGGAVKYATTHKINIDSWRRLACDNGLKPRGLAQLLPSRAPTEIDLITWRDMTQEERNAAGGSSKYAISNKIGFGTWKNLTNNKGLNEKGQARLFAYGNRNIRRTKIKMEPEKPSDSANKITMIMLDDTTLGEVVVTREVRLISSDKLDEIPVVDNSIPILHNGEEPLTSLTLQAEDVFDASKIPASSVKWLELNPLFDAMLPAAAAKVKAVLTAEFRRQVKNERGLAADMEKMMEIRPSIHTNAQGEKVNLGNGVFNPGPGVVKKLTALGPYAGKFENTPGAVCHAQRKTGTFRAASHSWDTRVSKPSRGINAWGKGNVLRNINTGKMGNAPAIAENNVAAVKFGKNLIFYVTLKDIQPNEEYFVNYGTAYNPHAITGGQLIKTEPLDQ